MEPKFRIGFICVVQRMQLLMYLKAIDEIEHFKVLVKIKYTPWR
jgi:hypothetical protein